MISRLLLDFNFSAVDSQNNFHRSWFPHECRQRKKLLIGRNVRDLWEWRQFLMTLIYEEKSHLCRDGNIGMALVSTGKNHISWLVLLYSLSFLLEEQSVAFHLKKKAAGTHIQLDLQQSIVVSLGNRKPTVHLSSAIK